MSLLIRDLTPEEVETMTRIRSQLAAAKYPATFRVPVRYLDIVDAYFQKAQAAAIAEWEAAGSPNDWPNPKWIRFCGPHGGPMFKNVELLPDRTGGAV